MSKKLGTFSIEAQIADSGFICLAGENGSGKSSLMRTVAGLVKPDRGYVRVGGADITDRPVEARGIVLVTPGSCIPHLEVDAHLTWGSRLKGVTVSTERLSGVKSELGIDFGGRVSKLSLGMRERVALATALLASPRAVLVDEAFSNLHGKEEFIGSYRRLASSAGLDVVFSTQDRSEGTLSDHLYAISDGVTSRLG